MHAPSVAANLSKRGWDVIAVADEPELRGLPDTDIMVHATREDRVIVTENITDFSILATRWVSSGDEHAGIVFTNPLRFNRASLAYPGNLIKALDNLLNEPAGTGPSWIRWL